MDLCSIAQCAQMAILRKKLSSENSKVNTAIKNSYLYREFPQESFETGLRTIRLVVFELSGFFFVFGLSFFTYFFFKFKNFVK